MCTTEWLEDQWAYLQISPTIEEVAHVVVAHAYAFFDEVGLVVVQFSLEPIMPLCCLTLLLLELCPAVGVCV